jgi:hypothetical protein
MSGYNPDKQVTGRWGSCIVEAGCMTVAADLETATFASRTIAIPTRLTRVIAGMATADYTAVQGYPVSVCAGGWLDFTFSDATMTGFRYIVAGF